jgi:phosphomannomutase/phosphoglucomutase
MSVSGKSLAQLVDERINKFPCSGEINYKVDDVKAAIEKILAFYTPFDPKVDRTDGISVEFEDWRFSLRGSNTEPLLRLNVETRANEPLLDEKVIQIEKLIHS